MNARSIPSHIATANAVTAPEHDDAPLFAQLVRDFESARAAFDDEPTKENQDYMFFLARAVARAA